MENALAPRIAPAARPAPANALAGLYFDPRYSDVASNPTPQFDPTMRGARDYAMDPRSVGNQIVVNMATSAAPVDVRGGARAVQGVRAYHGSPHRFDRFDPEVPVHWFAESERSARLFGRDRMRVPLHSAENPNMYEVNIGGRLMTVDPMAEAASIARQIDVPPPANWQEAADLLQWASAQDDWVRMARETGHDGVRFLNVGDIPGNAGSSHVETHYAVTNPDVIEILRRYGLLGMLGGGAAAASGGEAEAAQ